SQLLHTIGGVGARRASPAWMRVVESRSDAAMRAENVKLFIERPEWTTIKVSRMQDRWQPPALAETRSNCKRSPRPRGCNHAEKAVTAAAAHRVTTARLCTSAQVSAPDSMREP